MAPVADHGVPTPMLFAPALHHVNISYLKTFHSTNKKNIYFVIKIYKTINIFNLTFIVIN